MKRHPEAGAGLLIGVAGFEKVSTAILAHHECYDGLGYPFGLAGLDIPMEARIVSVVDAYDAMTSHRPYRQAMSHKEAVEQLNRNSGAQFDPTVVAAANAVFASA
jgi:HD-GYP domain-containing protein (c-di-GMP phosphodiesterase class II)